MTQRSPNLVLTPRDTELLEVLTRRIRMLSITQIGRVWWPTSESPEAIARRRLVQLEQAGYLERLSVMAHPELELAQPVAVWRPGLPTPELGPISWRLKSRWTEPLVNTACVIATKFAGRFLGGYGGRKPRRAETTHDLHLSSVFLQMRTRQPERAATWISEADRKKETGYGEKLPDGIVLDGDHKTAIEFGGAYDRPKLEEFHEFCHDQKLAYEIW